MHIKTIHHAHASAAPASIGNCEIVIVSSPSTAHQPQQHQQQIQQQQHQSLPPTTTTTEISLPFNVHLSAVSAEAHAAAQAAAMAAAQAAAVQAAAAEQQHTILQQHPLAHLVATATHGSPTISSGDPQQQHFISRDVVVMSNGLAHNGNVTLEQHSPNSGSGSGGAEKPFQCSVCERRFRQLSTLTNHVKIHTGEKPYKCNICDKTFRQSSTLTNHLKIHTGEKPFTCTYCPKHFRQLSTLTNHLKIHTGEKPFECAVCKKQFRQSSTLNNHIKIHVMDKVYVPVKIKTEEEEG